MDQSTGAPRANETVSVTVTIYDNTGKSLCTSSESVTTNDFGMLSMLVGDSSTFQNLSEGVLPLWVEARVGGVTIGKSQIINVPVAEYTRKYGNLTVEKLCSKSWSRTGTSGTYFHFNRDGTVRKTYSGGSQSYKYYISGDFVIWYGSNAGSSGFLLMYIPDIDRLHGASYF